MKILLLLILSISFCFAEKPQLARLHYDGGGDWYNDSDTIPNIAEYLNETINTDFSLTQAIIRSADVNIFDYPFLFMTGHGNVRFNEKEAEHLRDYLLRGGFLYADDDYGMDTSFRHEIKKIFPEKELVELPGNHEIFHSYFEFPEGLPKIHKHDDKRPQAFAIFADDGRLMVLYTYESNISDGWSNAHDDPPQIREKAFRFGANMFHYLMTR